MPEEEKPDEPKTDAPATWQFHNEDAPADDVSALTTPDIEPIEWTASEFIAHSKSSGWYMLLIGGTFVVTILTFFVTRDYLATAMVVIICVIFGVFAGRQPRELHYRLDDAGLHIDNKTYPYSGFRSFALMQEDGIESIWLMPLKRFMPQLTIYFAPEDGDKIANTLGAYLPLENHQPDPIDRLIHKLRF